MKSIVQVVLVLSLFTGSMPVQAQTPPSNAAAKIAKKSQLHDGCHSHYAKMSGKPCH